VRTGQPCVRASLRRRRSGFTATGRPAAERSGRSDIESEYAAARDRSAGPISTRSRATLPRPWQKGPLGAEGPGRRLDQWLRAGRGDDAEVPGGEVAVEEPPGAGAGGAGQVVPEPLRHVEERARLPVGDVGQERGEESVGGGAALAPPHEARGDGGCPPGRGGVSRQRTLPGEIAGHAAAADHAGAVQRPPEEAQTGPGEQRPVEIEHRQPAMMVREPGGRFRRTRGGDVVSSDVDPGAHGPMMRAGAVEFMNTGGDRR
jgi:hypothetical protein